MSVAECGIQRATRSWVLTSKDEKGVDPAAVAEQDVRVEAVADHDHLGFVQLVPGGCRARREKVSRACEA